MPDLSWIAARARQLRNDPTDAERHLWRALRRRRFAGNKFRRQAPIGSYIADFVSFEARLVVEVDGGQHAEQLAYDNARDRWLRGAGFRVLRFSDRDVLTALESVEQAIWVALHENPPPSPTSGEGADGRSRHPARDQSSSTRLQTSSPSPLKGEGRGGGASHA